jgi:hypothetical protein
MSQFFGCSFSRTGLHGELYDIAKGFEVYTSKNPNILGNKIWKTWYSYLREYGYMHTGEAYNLKDGDPIVASASGIVVEANRLVGSGKNMMKKSGDRVKIVHEEISEAQIKVLWQENRFLTSVYYHMREYSTPLRVGDFVERGDVIGRVGAPHNMHFKHLIESWGKREQPNYYGHNMGYMDYWDSKTDLDISLENAREKKHFQYDLIRELMDRYQGPESNVIKGLERGLIHKGRWSEENSSWSIVERFKLLEYLFRNSPHFFDEKDKPIQNIVAEVYRNQPVVLTLPITR